MQILVSSVFQYVFVFFLKDRRGTIKKIADFLGKSLTAVDIDRVMEHTSLKNMKKNEAVNLIYREKLHGTDKTDGAFINNGMCTFVLLHFKGCNSFVSPFVLSSFYTKILLFHICFIYVYVRPSARWE